MAEESFEEKSEKATPKRRDEARKKGEVAKSRELPSVSVLLAGVITLAFLGSFTYGRIQLMMRTALSHVDTRTVNVVDLMAYANQILLIAFQIVAPMMLAIFVTAILTNVVQVGFMLSTESIKPKFSKLDPIKGFGRLLSKRSLMEMAKTLLKLFIVGGVAYLTIEGEMENAVQLGDMSLSAIFSYTAITTFKIFMKCILAMAFLVVIDYAFQKYEFEKKLKMSKKEVKDEFKRTEGDPLVKSRIKSIQMEMARKRMMQDVPKADVVITNPTHIATALKYDIATMAAPRLLAKGAGLVAERIKSLAKESGIPIVENKAIARSLYRLVEIGQEIPFDLYQAVAEILAHIYKLKQPGNLNTAG